MPLLPFEDFISCFRKQFIFQVGHGYPVRGRRSKYYTAQNAEQGLKNDQWAICVFIHTGTLYGFSDKEMLAELNIKKSLYDVLKEETENIIHPAYTDAKLHKKVMCKIGLVKNAIAYTHKVKLPRKSVFAD